MNSNGILSKYYDLESNEYACKYSSEIESKPFDQYILKRFSDGFNKNSLIGEIGCGPAQVLKYVLKTKDCRFIGLDLSFLMLKEGKKLIKNATFINGDMFHMPCKDNLFDGIISFYSIVHTKEDYLDSLFIEYSRILKNKGRVVLSFHVGDKNVEIMKEDLTVEYIYHTYTNVLDRLKKNNFKYIEAVIRLPYLGKEYPSNRAYILCEKDEIS